MNFVYSKNNYFIGQHFPVFVLIFPLLFYEVMLRNEKKFLNEFFLKQKFCSFENSNIKEARLMSLNVLFICMPCM